MSPKRCGNISITQRETLLEFLKDNQKLISGKFSNDFTFKDAQASWQNLSEILNAIPGAKKDWQQWRKTWHDMRTKTKTKKSKLNYYASGTGGGKASSDSLSLTEIQVLDLISPTVTDGHPHILESEVNFEYDYENMEVIFENESKVVFENNEVAVKPHPSASADVHFGIDSNKNDVPTISETEVQKKCGTALPKNTPKKTKQKSVATQRLTQSIAASNKLSAAYEKKITIKEAYYKRKLELLEQQTKIMEQRTKAMERVATAIENLVSKNDV